MKAALVLVVALCCAWTLASRNAVLVNRTNQPGYPDRFETNYALCLSIVEPNTNTWSIEASTDLVSWSGVGTYATGNQEKCYFTSLDQGPPNSPFAAVTFYRARLLQ